MDQQEITRNPDRVYQTDAIEVEWEARYCIHSARCINTQPEVFDPRRRPWVVLENGTPDEVATAVFRCPTGALHYRRLDGGPEEPIPEETIVFPSRNGRCSSRCTSRTPTLPGTRTVPTHRTCAMRSSATMGTSATS